ncbi:hypothetical protein MPTK1_8g02740 [Marchantia polymorpha subsp. ruderalis]|uniref:Uncharacterized protein n=1 Tax=Marchantia polymorpha TaxID=3197 RepID=A0A2R6XJ49_MARPO|nr:hypothetical protein MARPO_0012s0066 [Marchantia polymorpha]BBN18465.1 hypothetical protein Mp_8g02740 [Marchantia polymorpha subsp. ruderalis]|eukprot:PTQ46109.1 hypothetical protein MARPO_0012s0066 [Marchantia polymorpha]
MRWGVCILVGTTRAGRWANRSFEVGGFISPSAKADSSFRDMTFGCNGASSAFGAGAELSLQPAAENESLYSLTCSPSVTSSICSTFTSSSSLLPTNCAYPPPALARYSTRSCHTSSPIPRENTLKSTPAHSLLIKFILQNLFLVRA